MNKLIPEIRNLVAIGEKAVSVITPFHNSADTLARCIEGVLSQSFTNFEYVLADNCSNDGSGDIARSYLFKDPRVRYKHFAELLPQGENYNRALREISPGASYCKMVQADDLLYPKCLEAMMELAERHPTAGVISGVRDVEGELDPANAKSLAEFIIGREICRATIRGNVYAFGSPTTVMYRADLVRARPEFFRKGAFFDDTDAVLELLKEFDFAFSQERLTHTSRDPNSIFGSVISYDVFLLYRYLTVNRMGEAFFSSRELAELKGELGEQYYEQLVRALVRRRDRRAYLKFHSSVLQDGAAMKISVPKAAVSFCRQVARLLSRRLGLPHANVPSPQAKS